MKKACYEMFPREKFQKHVVDGVNSSKLVTFTVLNSSILNRYGPFKDTDKWVLYISDIDHMIYMTPKDDMEKHEMIEYLVDSKEINDDIS